MNKVIDGERMLCCDNCKKPVGVFKFRAEDRNLDKMAGYVLGVGRNSGIFLSRPGLPAGPIIEHPLACSDKCEDRLLQTWPRVDAKDVHSHEWGEDFRDADKVSTRKKFIPDDNPPAKE